MKYRGTLKLALTSCLTLLALSPMSQPHADERIDDQQRRDQVLASIERDKLQRLKGWKRIVFHCNPPVSAPASEMFAQICDQTTANLRSLAAIAKANVLVVQDTKTLGFSSALHGMLQLEVEVTYVGCSSVNCAVSAVVTASFPYDQAVDMKARSYPVDPKNRQGQYDSPATIPRPIDAVMWGPRQINAQGSAGDEMASSIARAIDTLLKDFFTDYVQANRD